MKTFFLEQSRKKSKIKEFIKKVDKRGNKIIINVNLEKARFKTKIKVSKKIKSILESERSRQIVIQNKIKNDKQLLNLLYGYNLNICNSKWLFKRIIEIIIEEILNDKKKEESEIWICVNELDSLIEKYIFYFAKEFRRTNIITNNIGKFKKIEEKLYESDGILINITNNKRKSLIKADLILNVDFPKEILNQFTIYDKAIIINLDENIKINKKRFNGKIINDFKIAFNKENEISKFIKENELNDYDERDICQALKIVPEIELGGILW